MITVIYGLFIHVNVGPSQMFSNKYSEISAKNLQYNVDVVLAGIYIIQIMNVYECNGTNIFTR